MIFLYEQNVFFKYHRKYKKKCRRVSKIVLFRFENFIEKITLFNTNLKNKESHKNKTRYPTVGLVGMLAAAAAYRSPLQPTAPSRPQRGRRATDGLTTPLLNSHKIY